MRVPAKYHLLIATLYSVYFALATFALNPFVFLPNHTPWITYPIIFIISFLLSWSLIKLFSKTFPNAFWHLLIVGCIFSISLVSGITIGFLNDSTNVDLLLYYNSFLILPILPASIYILWLMYFDLSKRVVISTENHETTDHSFQKLFRITNSRNEILLESPIEKIIAFEANDNYVNTYHLNADGSVDKMMHRISLKKITELLDQIDVEFHRVHKSYLINPEYIQKLKGKSQAYRIELTYLSIEVPVSRTFDVKLIQAKNS